LLDKIEINDIIGIAKLAGDAILDIYNQDFAVEYKDDSSPLTLADKAANEIICERLTKLYPQIPIISEENKETPYEIRRQYEYFWLVDPLDGTKEFVKKNGEFTVNIALIHSGNPVLGVVYAPVIDTLYYAKKGEGAFKNSQNQITKLPITRNDDKLIIVASKSHNTPQTQEFIENIETDKQKEFVSMGSSLKLCLVAEGAADVYPRLAPTMEWDTAAADAVVRESGKNTLDFETKMPLVYNKTSLLNPFFVVN
jgi:3'(2'), 5'-bisphosphate nucleotidase